MEKFAIGPMLRDSVVAALRHGGFFILAFVALSAALLINTVLITRCVMSPSCVPTSVFTAVMSNLDTVIWSANRAANWLITGFAIFRVLGAGVEGGGGNERTGRPRRRGFGRCVLYLVSISASYFIVDAAHRFLGPAVYSANSSGLWIAFVAASGVVQVGVWAYVDARFAPYIASLACGGRAEGFFASWKNLKGNRARVFLLFFILEGTTGLIQSVVPDWRHLAMDLMLLLADIARLAGIPPSALVQRMPDMVEFAIYVVVSNMLCAGAILVVYQRMKAVSPERQAAVFD
jgi:hypothetical protein